MKKDASVALFHGMRMQAIKNELEYKKTLIELIEPSEDERADGILKKLREELEEHERALEECEADWEKAVAEYRED